MVSLDSLEGQVIGQYELRKLVGMGGMGAVYRGLQTTLQRDVAVKVLSSQLSNSDEYIERFKREARISANLEHPHIVPIYDYGAEGDVIYVVMRLLTGGSLEERFGYNRSHDRPLPSLSEITTVLKQLAAALDYAHREGVVHRDIKASNVMFDKHGDAFLVDFGIAKIMGMTSNLTGTGMTVGTPSYMSPEQWRGEPPVAESDQYSLAVMAFALLTGRLPFVAESQPALLYKHLNEPVPSAYALRPELGQAVDAVFERAMHKDFHERYETVGEFVEALANVLPNSATMSELHQPTGFFTTTLPSHGRTERTPATGSRPRVVVPPPPQKFYDGVTEKRSDTMPRQPEKRSNTMPRQPEPKRGGVPMVAIVTAAVLMLLGGFLLISYAQGQGDSPSGLFVALGFIQTDEPPPTLTSSQATDTPESVEPIAVDAESLTKSAPTLTSLPNMTNTPTVPEVNAVRSNVVVRVGPDDSYNIVTTLNAEQRANIIGISEDGQWYQIDTSAGVGWVRISSSITTGGDLRLIPVMLAPTLTPTNTIAPSPTYTRTIAPTVPPVQPTWTPLPAQPTASGNTFGSIITDCSGSLSSRLSVGMIGYVLDDDPRSLNVRMGPSTTSTKIGSIPVGGIFNVLEGPSCGEGITWFRVQYDSLTGWIAEGDETYFTGPYDPSTPIPAAQSQTQINDAITSLGSCERVLLEEDFSGTLSTTWFEVTDSSRYSIQVRDGGYQINMISIVPSPGIDPVSWGSLQDYRFGDARVDAVIRSTQFNPNPTSRTGIWVRYQNENNFLAFMINSTGKYRIARFEDEYTDLVGWSNSSAILQGDNAVNVITLLIKDNVYDFYINNQFVDRVTDTRWNDGRLSFFGSTTDQPAIYSLEHLRICAN